MGQVLSMLKTKEFFNIFDFLRNGIFMQYNLACFNGSRGSFFWKNPINNDVLSRKMTMRLNC